MVFLTGVHTLCSHKNSHNHLLFECKSELSFVCPDDLNKEKVVKNEDEFFSLMFTLTIRFVVSHPGMDYCMDCYVTRE